MPSSVGSGVCQVVMGFHVAAMLLSLKYIHAANAAKMPARTIMLMRLFCREQFCTTPDLLSCFGYFCDRFRTMDLTRTS